MQRHSLIPFPVLTALMVLILSSCGRTPDVAQWRVLEIPFLSETDYARQGADRVLLDVTFTNAESGMSLVIPAFWDGGASFMVRFAPPRTGRWTWTTRCSEDASLDGLSGSLLCGRYTGDLDIYRHGFVRAEAGTKYLMYDDGTPFFYLGDTHWGMYREELLEAGPHAGLIHTDSHFGYIVQRRAEQGFTVYQSEPIDAPFTITDGRVDQDDIQGFRMADRYYQAIAEAGLVHANADLFYVGEMREDLTLEQLERLSRYWVARFGAYPVLWTLAQEMDNDFYREMEYQTFYSSASNPWVKVAEFIHRHDAYGHPLSGHQENTSHTTVTGLGTSPDRNAVSAAGASAFLDTEVARRTGHNWWAAQWSPSLTATSSADVPLDYLSSPYPAVNYEGRYCHLWTKDFGARAQGWISYLSGFAGYGYGAVDMWLYKSTYDVDSTSWDGIDQITPQDKQTPWSTAIEFPSALQMGILKAFMTRMDWWNLRPVLKGDAAFRPEEDTAWAMASTKDCSVLYFYSRSLSTGTLQGLQEETELNLSWLNPRTGQTSEPLRMKTGPDGALKLPQKPDQQDWVLSIKN